MKRVGIANIGVKVPIHSLLIRDLAIARGMPPEKAEALGVVRARIPIGISISELVVAAIQKIPHEDVRSFIFATESDSNLSRPIALEALERLGLLGNVSVAQLKFACLAGTQALIWACREAILSGESVIVGMVDRSVYRDDDLSAEVTGGCGAVSLRIENSPNTKIEVEFDACGFYVADILDFHVPVSSYPFPEINGSYSTVSYCYCIVMAYQDWKEKNRKWVSAPFENLDFFLHVPFPRMVEWGAASLWGWEKIGELPLSPEDYLANPERLAEERARLRRIRKTVGFQRFFNARVLPYLLYNSLTGNIYTGAVYLPVIAAAERGSREGLVISYGSGAGSIVVKINIVDRIYTDLAAQIEQEKPISVAEFDDWKKGLLL